MRTAVFLATCLSLVALAWGNNLIMGRRQPGEIIVVDTIIARPRIFGRPQFALCNATAPSGSEISFVSAIASNPWIVSIRPVAGGMRTESIVLAAVGKPSWGFSIRCTVLAVFKKTTTSTTTTTTPSTTTSTTPSTTTSTTPSTTTSTTPSTTTSTTPSTTSSTPSTTTSTTPSTTTSTTPSTTTSTTPSTTTSTTPSTTVETTTEEPCTSTSEPPEILAKM